MKNIFISNQPNSADESQNARNNIPPPKGKNPAVNQVTSLTAQGVIDMMNQKTNSANWDTNIDATKSIEDFINASNFLNNTRSMRELFQKDSAIKDLVPQVVAQIFWEYVHATNIIREWNTIKIFADPTGYNEYKSAAPCKFVFSLQENGLVLVEGQRHTSEKGNYGDGRFSFQFKYVNSKEVDVVPAPIPEIFQNKDILAEQIRNAFQYENVRIKNMTHKNGEIWCDAIVVISDRWEIPTRFQIARNKKTQIGVNDYSQYTIIRKHLHMPDEYRDNLNNFDTSTLPLPEYLNHPKNVKKIIQQIMKDNDFNTEWIIENIQIQQHDNTITVGIKEGKEKFAQVGWYTIKRNESGQIVFTDSQTEYPIMLPTPFVQKIRNSINEARSDQHF